MIKLTTTPNFQVKYKELVKRFPALQRQLLMLTEVLTKNPFYGTPLGGNLFKIRLPNKAKVKGKRSGFRVVTYFLHENQSGVQELFLITIYDKSDTENVSKKTLLALLKRIFSQ
ncbi:MAG TPA: hypothetical protein PK715_13375 [Chitinophagales bacterium]|mgnify:CR=1 FL=1|nr:hypothetical protein [Chitinophagales bacterium]